MRSRSFRPNGRLSRQSRLPRPRRSGRLQKRKHRKRRRSRTPGGTLVPPAFVSTLCLALEGAMIASIQPRDDVAGATVNCTISTLRRSSIFLNRKAPGHSFAAAILIDYRCKLSLNWLPQACRHLSPCGTGSAERARSGEAKGPGFRRFQGQYTLMWLTASKRAAWGKSGILHRTLGPSVLYTRELCRPQFYRRDRRGAECLLGPVCVPDEVA